jgi:hypothetical protein
MEKEGVSEAERNNNEGKKKKERKSTEMKERG